MGYFKKTFVSVVLPVFNCEKYIAEAVNSILCQTFQEFELIIVDDKSTDNTVEVIKAFKDPRIKLLLNESNVGRAGSDTHALPFVQGKYIAKMDGDDISHPERFAKQVSFLESNADVNVVGSWIKSFGNSTFLHTYPSGPKEVICRTFFGMPVGNPSIMMRSDLFLEKGLHYNTLLRQAEDYDFFARYKDQLKVHVLPEPLLNYRVYSNDSRPGIICERKKEVELIRRRFLLSQGFSLAEDELKLLDLLYNLDQPLSPYTLEDIAHLFEKVLLINKEVKAFDEVCLSKFLGYRWFSACYHYPQKRLGSLREFSKQNISKYYSIPFLLKLKMLGKGVYNI